MKKQSYICLFLYLLFNNFTVAELLLCDGAIHNIDYHPEEDRVRIDYESPGMGTVLNVLSGGSMWELWAHNDSTVNMNGGYSQYFRSWDNTHVTIYDGGCGDFLASDNSHITMFGGDIDELRPTNNSHVNIYDGNVDILLGSKNSYIEITGGVIQKVVASENCHILISGGKFSPVPSNYTVTGLQYIDDESVITFLGKNFAIDGIPVEYGQYTALDFTESLLTGELASGEILNNHFFLEDRSMIILAPAPEPASLLLLGLGSLLIRKR